MLLDSVLLAVSNIFPCLGRHDDCDHEPDGS